MYLEMTMRALRIIGLLALTTLASHVAPAQCPRIDKNSDCPEVVSSAYCQDDFSSHQHLIVTDCEGNIFRCPFARPIQRQRIIATPVIVPTNWTSPLHQSFTLTMPGAEIPLYLAAANDLEAHFRNPIDSAEDAFYRMLSMTHVKGGIGRPSITGCHPYRSKGADS
jgi:hypothetical protein